MATLIVCRAVIERCIADELGLLANMDLFPETEPDLERRRVECMKKIEVLRKMLKEARDGN